MISDHQNRVSHHKLYRFFLFVLKGPYDPRVPPLLKFSQGSESARPTKIILSKSTVKTLNTSTVKIVNRNLKYEVIVF